MNCCPASANYVVEIRSGVGSLFMTLNIETDVFYWKLHGTADQGCPDRIASEIL